LPKLGFADPCLEYLRSRRRSRSVPNFGSQIDQQNLFAFLSDDRAIRGNYLLVTGVFSLDRTKEFCTRTFAPSALLFGRFYSTKRL
jgi:hypothetical protein